MWHEEEKRLSIAGGVKVSFDQGWQKQGRAHNSRTGQGTLVGFATGKCIDFGTKNTYCRKCLEAEKKGLTAELHDCRQNHYGSAKAMEAAVAVDLFRKEEYSVLIGDDDSTVISKLREEVASEIEKWSDVNHATCTMTKALYEGRGTNFGPDSDKLTDKVIEHVKTCFSYAVHQNRNNPAGLSSAIKAIVPHSFGDHAQCGVWCRYREDPEGYRHSTLPGGRDLKGEGLRQFLTDVLSPFAKEEIARKLAPVGSTQRNECLNSLVGTKNPKKRFYGGSESSDFRTAAAVVQFNEGYEYLSQVESKISTTAGENLSNYVESMQRKHQRSATRKRTMSTKRKRKERKMKRNVRQTRAERSEGTMYSSGIGLQFVTDEEIASLAVSGKQSVVDEFLKEKRTAPVKPTPKSQVPEQHGLSSFVYDIETTGLSKEAEIIQLACVNITGEHMFSSYVLPTCSIERSASKVTGLTIGYSGGARTLCKDGKAVKAENLTTVLANFSDYLTSSSGGQPCLLIAHNGNSFDAPRLVGKIAACDATSSFDNVYFGDSLPSLRKVLNRKNQIKLVDVYEECMKEKFNAHDALEDCKALKAVINHYGQSLRKRIHQGATPISFLLEKRMCEAAIVANKKTYIGKLASKVTIEKLSKLGIAYELFKEINEKCGKEAVVAFLACKSRGHPKVTSDVAGSEIATHWSPMRPKIECWQPEF